MGPLQEGGSQGQCGAEAFGWERRWDCTEYTDLDSGCFCGTARGGALAEGLLPALLPGSH